MSKLSEYLAHPAPIDDKHWHTVILATGVAATILAIFEPFAFRLNSVGQFFMLLGFALLVFFTSTLFFVVLPRLFPSFFTSGRWTRGRMYLYIFLFLSFSGFCVFLYEYVWIGNHPAGEYWTKHFFTIFFIDMAAAITIGLIPLTISMYMVKNRNLKKNLFEANQLNASLSQRLKQEGLNDVIVLEGSTKDSISVNADAILYISSAGNYVEVVYEEENGFRKKMLRSTIKQVEIILQSYPVFIRCHRAFIVNVNQIANISGNAQGYRLTLYHTKEEIPVSRTYMKSLKDALKQ